MARALTRGRLASVVLSAAGLALAAAAPAIAATTPGPVLDDSASLWVNPDSTTLKAAAALEGQDRVDAELLAQYPTASWLTGGTPQEAQKAAKAIVNGAHKDGDVPVIVIYNLPYRDCGQYSSGGAAGTAAYDAWIDGVVRGIGNKEAAIILEPDGLGLIPNYVSELDGSSNCTMPAPEGVDPASDAAPTPENRFAQLNYAVDAFAHHKNTDVYLDATHTGWQNVGESADRLIKAGVQDAQGFFLNVSNYQYTQNLVQYGTWVSSCITYVTDVNPGDFASCGNQYWSGGPANGWTGVSLDPFKVWSDTATDPTANTAGINSRYESILGGAEPTAHFVIDTSRNGQGPWAGTLDWCNPPGRGLGETPTTDTGDELVDAYLWIKVPGESDGQCDRPAAGAASGTDGEWGGITDPAAGAWFPQQAAELIELANPSIR